MNNDKDVFSQLAETLIKKFGLVGWQFQFDNAKRRYGLCSYKNKTIYVSIVLFELNEYYASIDVLLHELAHAIVGAKNGHNEVWKQKALELGCSATRCHSYETAPPKFIGTCVVCNRVIKRHRRTTIACGQCCKKYNNGKYNEAFNFVWSD